MNSEAEAARSLYDIEMEVLAEGREWTRKRLQERLQQEADRQGGVFPPERPEDQASAEKTDAPANRHRSR